MGASTALFVVGLVDDFLHIKPYQKLIGQVLGASAVVYFGLLLPWGWGASVAMAVTIFWLIGITNAINLLDNMDGLAAGISAIAAGFIAASFAVNGQTTEAVDALGLRRGARRLPRLQLEPGVDLHGRLRVDVRRLLPRQLGSALGLG